VLTLDETTRSNIRHIFLSPRPNFALLNAADMLGMTLKQLKREIEDGVIVAVSTRLGQRMAREELIATAMRVYEQSVIEEALGDDASVLPEAIRNCASRVVGCRLIAASPRSLSWSPRGVGGVYGLGRAVTRRREERRSFRAFVVVGGMVEAEERPSGACFGAPKVFSYTPRVFSQTPRVYSYTLGVFS